MSKFKTITNDVLGARAGELKGEGKRIPTPISVITSREIKFAKDIENKELAQVEYPHPIFEIVKYFSPERLNDLVSSGTNGEVFVAQKNEIEKQYNQKIQDIKYNSSSDQFEKRIVKTRDYVEDEEKIEETIPTLRMDTKDTTFIEKINRIVDNGFKKVNLIYASIGNFLPNYQYVQKISEKNDDILFIISEVEKTWRSNKKTSMLHILQLFGIDAFALKLVKPIKIGKYKVVWRKAKRLDRKTLGHITYDEHKKFYGEMNDCNCPVDEDRGITNFYDVFNGAELLREGIGVHNAFDSFREFLVGRKFIVEDNFRNYLRKKLFMIPAIRKIFGWDLNIPSYFKK